MDYISNYLNNWLLGLSTTTPRTPEVTTTSGSGGWSGPMRPPQVPGGHGVWINAGDEDRDKDDRLSFEELENLKKKCLSRMKDHQSTPIVVNPPVLSDFSNSQKLLNFLDEAEEKDKTILNRVKRSSYTIQVKVT